MIETCRLRNVIFLQTILSFVLSRKITKIYNDIAWKHGNITVKDFWKNEIKALEEQTQARHRFSQQLQTTWCVSEIPYL